MRRKFYFSGTRTINSRPLLTTCARIIHSLGLVKEPTTVQKSMGHSPRCGGLSQNHIHRGGMYKSLLPSITYKSPPTRVVNFPRKAPRGVDNDVNTICYLHVRFGSKKVQCRNIGFFFSQTLENHCDEALSSRSEFLWPIR